MRRRGRLDPLEDARHLLREYADWLIRNEAKLSGWPEGRASIEYQAIEGMARSTKPKGGLSYWKIPGRIERVHVAFLRLPDRYRYAVWVKYLAPRRNGAGELGALSADDLYRLSAAERGISSSELKRRMNLAEHYLAGLLANRLS